MSEQNFFGPMDFGNEPDDTGPDFGLIPAGALCWAVLLVRGIKTSKAGNTYADVELTIEGGQYDRRKMWDMIGLGGSEDYARIGRQSIKRILESGNAASPENMGGYSITGIDALSGMKVGIRTKIEKGGEYKDKNRPIYLTPNPSSNLAKDHAALAAGAAPAPRPPLQEVAPAAAQQNPAGAVAPGAISSNAGTTPSWL